MEKNTAVRIENLSKIYRLYDRHVDRLKESISIFRKKYHRTFYALKDITFEVKKGECLGIIGKNGSGKSTLLKIISGVLTPSSGKVELSGRVSALLELGVGFNPEMTGVENIYFNGAIAGFDKKAMDDRLDGIMSFADIGEFIYQPLKTYSTGMFMRLAFAAAINVDPDILIIDEALAVGDIRFQQKCFRKIREFSDNGKTVIFVSHDVGTVVNLCNRVLWLNDNAVFRSGNPEEITREYVAHMAYNSVTIKNTETRDGSDNFQDQCEVLDSEIPWDDLVGCSFFGQGSAQIRRAALYLKNSRERVTILKGGEDIVVALDILIKRDIRLPMIGVIVKDKYGDSILGINTHLCKTKLGPLFEGERISTRFSFRFPNPKNGKYVFSVAIAEGTFEDHVQHHWVHDAFVVELLNDDPKYRIGSYLTDDSVDIKVSKNSFACNRQ